MSAAPANILLLALCACGSRTGLALSREDTAPPEAGADARAPHDATPMSDDDAACRPGTCAGCCDDAGVCQPGTTVAACGEQGRSCTACNARYELCKPDPRNPDGQVCFSPCNFQACNGRCCQPDGTCVTGTDDVACGGGGTLCVDCTKTDLVCDATRSPPACATR